MKVIPLLVKEGAGVLKYLNTATHLHGPFSR